MFDAKVVYPGRWEDVTDVPALFRPQSGPLGLTDLEKVFAAAPSAWTNADIFAERGIGRPTARWSSSAPTSTSHTCCR